MRERSTPDDGLTELAQRIRAISHARFGDRCETTIVGLDAAMLEVQHRTLMCAQADSAVLITGETGTGKELFARALHLLGRRRQSAYLCVNCAQYQDTNLVASALFGHKRGSFTGAVADHRGVFEEAQGGVVFLDEIAELSLVAQAMLLRTLGEGEIIPVGEARPRHVNVRVLAATSRDLRALVARGQFREDLYYRLRTLQVRVPPLRARGQDVELLATHYLRDLGERGASRRRLTAAAGRALRGRPWPGNVRELRSVIETAYYTTQGESIDAPDVAEDPGDAPDAAVPFAAVPYGDVAIATAAFPAGAFGTPAAVAPRGEADGGEGASLIARLLQAMREDGRSFWTVVYEPFMARDLSRASVRAVIEAGLTATRGSYKRLVTHFGLAGDDYLRFMDFLRHHRLKPAREGEITDQWECPSVPADAARPLERR